MNLFVYAFNQQNLTFNIRHTAKRNIILRWGQYGIINISIPPHWDNAQLQQWLDQHPEFLTRFLQKMPPSTEQKLPEKIWFRGQICFLKTTHTSEIQYISNQNLFLLPEKDAIQQKQMLNAFFRQQARLVLLPRLQQHSFHLSLLPSQIDLSNARTFWGVCRSNRSIRLNWRLIGAPDFVIDYVCIHELCHLQEANHSHRFWHLVTQYTPHTNQAKAWLKQHGKQLFVLD